MCAQMRGMSRNRTNFSIYRIYNVQTNCGNDISNLDVFLEHLDIRHEIIHDAPLQKFYPKNRKIFKRRLLVFLHLRKTLETHESRFPAQVASQLMATKVADLQSIQLIHMQETQVRFQCH